MGGRANSNLEEYSPTSPSLALRPPVAEPKRKTKGKWAQMMLFLKVSPAEGWRVNLEEQRQKYLAGMRSYNNVETVQAPDQGPSGNLGNQGF